ncbi:putative SET domain protein [Trypanosoma theileri]|uniref:Putative SET domain protein n=1 Tax=Trypanosoma theileri TaxID=67003 RepID=A0A1X0P8J8_9TRYP|nr:putative SET domain protein [Trypanosoma theileri]ORC93198.1 putative SET domain protein [Trypanosoma theileri]
MSKGDVVAVFCNEEHEEEVMSRLNVLEGFPYRMFSLRNGPSMYLAVRSFFASREMYRCALNLCTGSTEDERSGSPVVLASLFEHCGVTYAGCRYDLLKQPLDILFMICFYAGMPLPRFSVIRTGADIELFDLQFPVRLRNADPLQGTFDCVLEKESTLHEVLKDAVKNYGKVVVWEVSGKKSTEMEVLVSGAGFVAFTQESIQDNILVQRFTPAIEKYAASFAKGVLDKNGYAKLLFNKSRHTDDLVLESVNLECSLIDLNSIILSPAATKDFLEECIRECERGCKPPVIELRFGGSNKGYFLCAAKEIKKGEYVFEDEGRSFSIVTKPFVMKRWDAEKKVLFAEYAWPLDADGHVYAIWEKDPCRWRPINHSCDPNCIFDEGHSLNVVAARDISKGDELTMDYSTFCDYTMKPFSCFCGSVCCRGLIIPDETSLKKYGTHTWHRRPPFRPSENS